MAVSSLAAPVVASADWDGEIRILAISPPGTVQVLPSGAASWVLTTTNQALVPGDRLRTGPNSLVRLIWSDRSVVSFGARTEIEILPREEERGSSGLSLMKGLMSFFHRDEPGRIRVRTKGANAGVEGTEFVLEVTSDTGEETTRLSVLDGTVRLSNDLGSVTVTNDQQAVAEAGVRPRFTAGFIANNVLQWTLYYPAVLDLPDLRLSREEEERLRASVNAYASGDLLAALEAYPVDRPPASDVDRVYYSALLLSVGQIAQAEALLDAMTAGGESDRLPRLAAALRTLIAAVKLQPRPVTVDPELPTELLAASYYEQSRAKGDESLQAALTLARKAANRSVDFGFAYARVAELELSFGRREKAKEALRWARSLTPRNAYALMMQGFVLASENKTRPAIEFFNQALAVDPALGNAWMGRGLCRIRRGDWKGGREDLLVAAAVEPQQAVLRSYLAKAYAEDGNGEKARHEVRLAQTLDKNDPTAWLYAALISQQNNQINQAIVDLQKSQELNDNRALFRSEMLLDQDQAVRSANLASVYRDAGMNDVAVREAAKAVTYDYANSSAHLFMSDSYNELRDPTQFNLRYETVWFNELLLANLLAPVGAARLSQTLGQFDNVRLFESDHAGLASSTYARSDGQVQQLASQFGTMGNTAWALDFDYRYQDGVRVNNELDSLGLTASIKQQITPEDSLLLIASYLDFSSGDNFQYYDPDNARTNYTFEEQQEPILALGYHHEWAPGVHTLVLGGWLNSRAQFGDTDVAQYWVRRPPDQGRLGSANFDVSYESDLQIYSAEVNQVVQKNRFTVVAGALWQGGEVSASDLWVNPDTINDFSPPPAAVGSFSEPYQRLQGYTYLTLEPVDRLWLTGGFSYDYIEYPEVFLNPPLSEGSATSDLLAPKAAIIWSPVQAATLRGMYSRSLGGFSLDQSFRLEPSQLAGFPQAFRTVITESLAGPVSVPEHEVFGLALDLKFDTGTYIGLQFDKIGSDVQRTVGIFRRNPGEKAFASTTEEQLDYNENTFSLVVNQMLGERFAIGVGYRFIDATLQDSLPELAQLDPFRFLGNSPPDPEREYHSYLHRIGGHLLYNHPSGIFSRFDVNYYQQSNDGPVEEPGDAFVQLDLLIGYRFARRRAELTFGILNLTDTDYQLSPLTQYAELPRERVFAVGLSFQF